MVVGRLREAVADVAETLRRIFSDVPVRQHPAALPQPRAQGAPRLEVAAVQPAFRFVAQPASPAWRVTGTVREEPTTWVPRHCREDAWDRWSAGAAVLTLEVFQPASRKQLRVPALPRAAGVARLEPGGFRLSLRQFRQPFPRPGVFRETAILPRPRVLRDLDRALGLPVAVGAEDLQRIPKALWMRYTLALVRGTGENIRALEVLGLFRVPSRGVTALHHDPRTGRLLLELTREASGAPRVPLILARRKEDRAILTCFPEDAS